ncbi:MAG: hypothetical protein QOD77_1331 [Thermoplasmata archaeon]|jgi:hypothetical protein|nr:hypothetical protein [Thermoplasmata archaeon]
MRLPLAVVAVALLLAGCSQQSSDTTTSSSPTQPPAAVPMAFATHVLPAVHAGHGLYEPTIDVSGSGVLYVSAHSTGVDVQGAPAFFSVDDGVTWSNLPLPGSPAGAPGEAQAGTTPPSDEIFIVAGTDGTAWGVDVTLFAFPVSGWCNDGAENCFYSPNAYDRAATTCAPSSLNDRPWAAYANGTLLMVNNPGGGPVQVGAMKVPPSEPLGVGNPATGPQWNMCAGEGGGSIPGIPDMREDLFFAVPQVQGGKLVVVTGNAADVGQVEQHDVLDQSTVGVSQIGDSGQVAFDKTGTMFVATMNNTAASGAGSGAFQVAFSTDDGASFTVGRWSFDLPVSSVYIDGNKFGPGLLVNWGLVDQAGTDWYFAHAFVEDGQLVLRDVSLAVDDGPEASRHVQGAAAGPDGRAYMIMSEVSGNDDAAMAAAVGTMPLSVVVQQAGPTLPVEA